MEERYLVVSPEFGEFKAGEPVAFELAKKYMKRYNPDMVAGDSIDGNKVLLEGRTITVFLKEYKNEPFRFIVVDLTGEDANDEA